MNNLQPEPAAHKHPNRPFAIAMIVLVLLFLAGLVGMAVWMVQEMGEFNPQAILSRITGKEVAMQLTDVPKAEDEQVVTQATTQLTQTSQVEGTAASGITDEKPTPGVIQVTRTPIPTPMPTTEVAVAATVAVAITEAPLATDTGSGGSTTSETSEATSEASPEAKTDQSTGSSSDPTTPELPDTGFMDELGLPILAMLGVILFLTILLIKHLRTSF